MSFMEKINLAALAGGVLALGWYLVRVVPQIGQVPLDEIAWKWPMAIAMGIDPSRVLNEIQCERC